MPYRYFLLFISLYLFPSLAMAQPADWKEAHKSIILSPLTEEEKAAIVASNSRSDTIDILNFDVNLEVIEFTPGIIRGWCGVRFSPKMDDVDYLALDLLELTIDSITMDGNMVNYAYDGLLLEISLPTVMNTGDEGEVKVYYHGEPEVDPSGFGGFDFNSNYAYNLGIGLASNPYNFGRSWHPCFDNFVERATYDFSIFTQGNRKAYCVGTFLEEAVVTGDTLVRRYRMDKPIPSYLSSIAVANYSESNIVHQGQYGPVNLQLIAKTPDLNDMVNTFATLGEAVDALEYWFGPYIWDRVGFITTVVGAMEHPTSIAYPASVSLGGDDFPHRRLMAHELAHCWFGNVVTLSTPADMWFKEGNAEYGAHLFTEYYLGREAFIDQVKDNFLGEVLKSAHFDDDGFQPLSGIPYEHTYGTHTYRKGASVLHNLRAYMGDSLFRVGQQAVLSNLAFTSIDAATYRDELMDATGLDLNSFFDNWIYAPGFAAYEIDLVDITPNGISYDASVSIQQKLRAAPELHTDTPIEITFREGNDGAVYTTQVMVSGEFTTVDLDLPFEPTMWYLNGNNKLNIAMMDDSRMIANTGTIPLAFAEARLTVNAVPEDSTFFRAEHYWVAPDEIGSNPFEADISENHYWRVIGDFPAGFDASMVLRYQGQSMPYLDEDLVGTTEDSIILVYRTEPGAPWVEFDDYVWNPIISVTDGQGEMIINSVRPGEYAFANGSLPLVSTNDLNLLPGIDVFPNPTTDYLDIKVDEDLQFEALQYQIFDLLGRTVQSGSLNNRIALGQQANGVYLLQIKESDGTIVGSQRFEILK